MKIEALIEALQQMAKNDPGAELFGKLSGMSKRDILTCRIADGIEVKYEQYSEQPN